MQTIHYPVKGRKLEETITQHTFDMLMTQVENWQQGPGVVGRLNLHSCWSEDSVLARRYQGETVTAFTDQMRVIKRLYEKTKNPKWRAMVNSMAAHLLYLQDSSGGFIHATAEFEPTFDTRGCPIHFFNPVIALCEYFMWEYADESIKALIPEAVDRQWEWSLTHSWQVGNGYRHPLDFPGWCGVTNQDLTAVGALAMTGKALGKWERFEEYGKPVLDHYLSSAYYHKEIGLFERGDGPNFAERTVYYIHILNMLKLIYETAGDERLKDAYDNVIDHLFDAVFVGEDGMTYLARGAITDPVDKSRVLGWEYGSIAFKGYPTLVRHMQNYLTRHPSPERSHVVEALRSTITGYIFVDGNIPMGIFNPNPLFTVVSVPDCEGFFQLVMDILGDQLKDPEPVELPIVHRTLRNITWKQNGRLWTIEEDGVRKYGGFTRYSGGITIGPDEKPVFGSYNALETCDYLEIIDA